MDTLPRQILPMLPVLVAFAETGQTTAAADVLQMPQSTVSRTLARIGTALGAPVVERRGRTLVLTPAGEALVPHASASSAAVEAGIEAVRALDPGAHGAITLAFQSTLGERVVPALIKAFLRDRPGATVELQQASHPQCLAAVLDGSAEIALVSPLAEEPRTTSLRLYTEPLVLVTPLGHRLASRPRIAFAEAADEAFVCMKSGYGMRTYLDGLAAKAGFTPNIRFEGDDLSTLRGLVSTGLGVCLAPRDPHGSFGCVEVPITDADAVRTIGACWPRSSASTLSAAFQALLRRRGRRLTEIGLRPPDA